jgi:diguanylate cyclase (GGDEF)-like protein
MSASRLSGQYPSGFAARIRRWPIWAVRPAGVVFLLAVELLAPGLTLFKLATEHVTTVEWLRVAAIAATAIGYAEVCDRTERIRRYVGDGRTHSNYFSAWAVAAVLVAPAGAACAVMALVYGHFMLVGRRHQSIRPHRTLFSGGVHLLAVWCASEIGEVLFGGEVPGHRLSAAAATVTVVAVLHVVDVVLLTIGMSLATGRRAPLPGRDKVRFETATQVLGVVGAQLLVYTPWLAPAAIGCLVAMHRASLVKDLQVVATTDSKTTLLNAAAWRERAEVVLHRAVRERQRVALIVIDLDHFKRVNDTYGHLVGDDVLRAIGGLLKKEARGHDLVGRFGGEEFLVLIDGRTAAAHAVDMATRLRARIAALEFSTGLRVTASLGVAHLVPDEVNVDVLLAAADEALYAAKAAGRDRVHAVAG